MCRAGAKTTILGDDDMNNNPISDGLRIGITVFVALFAFLLACAVVVGFMWLVGTFIKKGRGKDEQ